MNAKDSCLTFHEYYDLATELCRNYAKEEHKIDLNIFQFVKISSRKKQYSLIPVASSLKNYDPRLPLCIFARENITVTPNGDVYPCTPSPGVYRAGGLQFGNVFEQGLKPRLQDGAFLSMQCKGVHAIEEHDPKCGACKYFKHCTGGCRLSAYALCKDSLAHDPSKCVFFEERYDKKLEGVLPGYECMNPVEVI